MIILIDGVRYVLRPPERESVLQDVIEKNHQHIFGEHSLYFRSEKKIVSGAGVGSIPDAYVLILGPDPQWCILEVELASHPLYDHIVSQLTRFNRGIEKGSSRKIIINMLYDAIKADSVLEAQVKKKIDSGEVFKFLSELISTDPTIVIAIDERTSELEEAIRDIRGKVIIMEFKTFGREGILEGVEAYLFDLPLGVEKKQVSRRYLSGRSRGLLGKV